MIPLFIQMSRSLRKEAGDGSFSSLHSSAQVCNVKVRLHSAKLNTKAKVLFDLLPLPDVNKKSGFLDPIWKRHGFCFCFRSLVS